MIRRVGEAQESAEEAMCCGARFGFYWKSGLGFGWEWECGLSEVTGDGGPPLGPSGWHGGGAFVSTDSTLPPRLGGHLPDTFGFHIYDILIITFFLICYNDVNKMYNRGVLPQKFMD